MSQFRLILCDESLPHILNAIPVMVVILNQDQQIIFANQCFCEKLGITDPSIIIGYKIGEAFCCVNAITGSGQGQCGNTQSCKHCEATKAIHSAQKGKKEERVCRIEKKENAQALDFRAFAVPTNLKGMKVIVYSIIDITFEKQREALERKFFHDITNTAAGLAGLSSFLGESDPTECKELLARVERLSQRLTEEIKAQCELINEHFL